MKYASTSSHALDFSHRDFLGRLITRHRRDYYLSPTDAKLKTLVVASTDNVLNQRNGTWKRTKLDSVVPLSYRVALWPLSHIPPENDTRGSWTGSDWVLLILKWIPTTLLLTILVRSTPFNMKWYCSRTGSNRQ